MLTNLFSMFDPTLHKVNPMLLVIVCIMFILLMSNQKFLPSNNMILSFSLFLSLLKQEFMNEILGMNQKKKSIKNLGAASVFFYILSFIFLVNFFSLFPYILSVTSHLSFNLPMALGIWGTIMVISLVINWKNFFAHLTPSGTPIALMSFMVLIETISNIIRPLTLSVRLMANMVAGHLLLLLLSNFTMLSFSNMFLSSLIMVILGVLEMGVSIIQAYVFVLLSILYAKETF